MSAIRAILKRHCTFVQACKGDKQIYVQLYRHPAAPRGEGVSTDLSLQIDIMVNYYYLIILLYFKIA